MSGIATTCLSCLSAVDRWCHITACLGGGRSRDGIYETTLADNEREAVSDLLGYLENVCRIFFPFFRRRPIGLFVGSAAWPVLLTLDLYLHSATKPIFSPESHYEL